MYIFYSNFEKSSLFAENSNINIVYSFSTFGEMTRWFIRIKKTPLWFIPGNMNHSEFFLHKSTAHGKYSGNGFKTVRVDLPAASGKHLVSKKV